MKKYLDMKPLTSLCLLCLLLTAGYAQSPKNLNLIKNKRSAYSIAIPEKPLEQEVRAAHFLQYHIERISGCVLPIVQSDATNSRHQIRIKGDNPDLKPEAFHVFTSGPELYIYGGSGKGCVYGVAELLEQHMGIKYLSPDYVIIPKQSSLSLPQLQIRCSTPNTYRNVNGQFTRNENYKDFHRLHTIDDMFAKGYFVHTFHRLLPWQTYFEKHPDYYAFMNGKRVIDQLCLSNPEVLALVISRLEEEMELQPEKKFWSVSQDDNFSYCQCEACSKVIEEEGSPAGPIIIFVNRVAEHFPDKVISTLAYQYSRKAPLKSKPASNVQIMLCTIELNRSKAIADDPSSRSFLRDIEDWGKISNHIFLWDYTVNFAHHITPFPNLHVLQPNIRLFVNNNVKEHFQQTNTNKGHEFSEMKAYLIAKLLWNPNANVDALVNEFTDAYYGGAAPWIRKYILHLQTEISKSGEWLDIYGPPTLHAHGFLSQENIKAYEVYFDEAEKAVAAEPHYLLHVRKARLPLQYAIMEIGKSDMFGPRGWYDEVDGDFRPREKMMKLLEAFSQTCRATDNPWMNESGLSSEEYIVSTLRFIDVQVKGNLAFRKKVKASPMPSEKYSGGDLRYLTNGVRGANDYKVHWIGWEGKDFSLELDLEKVESPQVIEISTLWDQKSWILHPLEIQCLVSEDGENFFLAGEQKVLGEQRSEAVNRTFSFDTKGLSYRYVRFDIKGSLRLFNWHPS